MGKDPLLAYRALTRCECEQIDLQEIDLQQIYA